MNYLGASLADNRSIPNSLVITEDNEPTAVAASSESGSYGGDLNIEMGDLVKHLKTNVKFKMSVITYMAHSVGIGYYITTAANNAGRKAKELIMDFEEDFDIDELNQKIGRDAWASGNAFLNVIPEVRG